MIRAAQKHNPETPGALRPHQGNGPQTAGDERKGRGQAER